MRLHASLCPHAMLARWQGAGALLILRPQTLHLPQTLHVTSWWCPSGCLSCCARAAYLVVADEQYGRQIPFAFLDKVPRGVRGEVRGEQPHPARAQPGQDARVRLMWTRLPHP